MHKHVLEDLPCSVMSAPPALCAWGPAPHLHEDPRTWMAQSAATASLQRAPPPTTPFFALGRALMPQHRELPSHNDTSTAHEHVPSSLQVFEKGPGEMTWCTWCASNQRSMA